MVHRGKLSKASQNFLGIHKFDDAAADSSTVALTGGVNTEVLSQHVLDKEKYEDMDPM